MNKHALEILETYIYEKKRPTLEEVGLANHEHAETSIPSFVTFFLGNEVVASTGRVYMNKDTTLEEFLDNVIIATEDPRFQKFITNPEKIRELVCRVDLLPSEHRTLIQETNDIDIEHQGVIVLAQKQQKLSVILPKMYHEAQNGDSLYRHACAKAGIEYKGGKKNDVLVYAMRTIIYE